ncbi:MAG TPA: EamA family transporter [Acidimicrobiia bacterium]|jgi:drug/metabolite transporter (DMT)-like permease
MSGVLWAAGAGIGFGLFQAFHRRANALIDAFGATFVLLVIASLTVGTVASLTEDVSILASTPGWAFGAFALAGLVQFFGGWTLLSLSQRRDGAARTGVAIAATPLIGSVAAAIFLDEPLTAIAAVGVILVVVGVVLIARRDGVTGSGLSAVPWYGLGSAACWGTAPLFVRWGLRGLDTPLIGVTLALASAAVVYAVVLLLHVGGTRLRVPPAAYRWILISSLLAATAITAQWQAWHLIEVTVAITLMQLATPVVVVVAPLVVGADLERPTATLLTGMAAVLGGSLLVLWAA